MHLRAVLLAGLAALTTAAPAHAATFTVTGGADGAGSCTGASCTTIRAALTAASSQGGPDVISLPARAYQVTQGQLVVNSEVTINGASAATTSITGDGKSSRVFNIGPDQRVTITHVTISNGATTSGDPDGGNVKVNTGADLTLDHVRITNGTALRGGGLAATTGTHVTITRSLIDNNHAIFAIGGPPSGEGGALIVVGDTKLAANALQISDSTIAFNDASQGAGIVLRGNPADSAQLDRVTIARNPAGSNSVGSGLGNPGAASIKVGSSIIAFNTGDGTPSQCEFNIKPTSLGGNIDTGTSCGFSAPADRPSTDPQISTLLSMAGGETPILSILATSPAVDFPPSCSAPDQRDLFRPQGRSCDSGAYEFDQSPDTSISVPAPSPSNDTTASFSFIASDPGSTFQCRIDTAPFTACTSPFTTAALAQGTHTFEVRARDAAGNLDPTPASQTFVIDTAAPGPPVIAVPLDNALLLTNTIEFRGTAEIASRVELREGPTLLGTAIASGTGNWTIVIGGSAVPDGVHTYAARAIDAATNTSGPTNRTVTVDTGLPDTTIVEGPTGPTNTATPTFRFSSEPGAKFECSLDSVAHTACPNPFTTPALGQGRHPLSVRAVDAAGNRDNTPATQSFAVDTVPPAEPAVVSGPSGPTTNPSPDFGFTTDAGTTTQCRLDGPSGQGSFQDCASPKSFSGLPPGDYTFFVRSTDAAGNSRTTSRSFTVTAVQQATPTPTPTATPTPSPTPVPQQSVVVQPAGGKVLVRVKGSNKFEELDVTKGIPTGSEVNVKNGRVRLTSVPKAGAPPESAVFFDGIFIVTQRNGITDLKLSEPLNGCKSARARAAAGKKVKTRKLWGSGRGSFRTTGQYSAATVRGTTWLVQDTCTSTLTRVTQGVVAVRDFAKRKTVLVKKGKRYTARKRR